MREMGSSGLRGCGLDDDDPPEDEDEADMTMCFYSIIGVLEVRRFVLLVLLLNRKPPE